MPYAFSPAEVLPNGSNEFVFFTNFFKYFGFSFTETVILDVDYSHPVTQRLLRNLTRDLWSANHVAFLAGRDEPSVTPWFLRFAEWANRTQYIFDQDVKAGLVRSARQDPGHEWFAWADPASSIAYRVLAHTGDPGQPLDESRVFSARLIDQDLIIAPHLYWHALTAFVETDFGNIGTSYATLDPEPPEWNPGPYKSYPDTASLYIPSGGPLRSSVVILVHMGLRDTATIVAHIKEQRALHAKYTRLGVPCFPRSLFISFYDQFVTMETAFVTCLVAIHLAIFGLISLLLFSVRAAAVTVGILFVNTMELLGYMWLIGIQMMPVPVMLVIVSVGLGVENSVHIAQAFTVGYGATRSERADAALGHMLGPIIHGTISTLLGVLMLFFSSFAFIVKYVFWVLVGCTAIGLFNGLILLPICLALFGPHHHHPEEHHEEKPDHDQVPD